MHQSLFTLLCGQVFDRLYENRFGLNSLYRLLINRPCRQIVRPIMFLTVFHTLIHWGQSDGVTLVSRNTILDLSLRLFITVLSITVHYRTLQIHYRLFITVHYRTGFGLGLNINRLLIFATRMRNSNQLVFHILVGYSPEVEILGHKRKVDLLPIRPVDDFIFATRMWQIISISHFTLWSIYFRHTFNVLTAIHILC